MISIVITALGNDRPGLVESLARVVADHGGNWEHSQMAELAGKFAGIIQVAAPPGAVDDLIAALDRLEADVYSTSQSSGATPTTTMPRPTGSHSTSSVRTTPES